MSYLRQLSEAIRAEVPARVVPEGADDLFLIYAVLARAKGETVMLEDVHDAWTAWMEIGGQHHESMVPFEQLPDPVRAEDRPFVAAIRTVARRSTGGHAGRLP
jgi:hypothetical protein